MTPIDQDFRIGAYRIIRHIAQGGMGAVYEVEDTDTAQRYALKLAATSQGSDARFNQIHRVLGALEHPGILRSHLCNVTPDGRPYMLFEMIDGVPSQVFAKSLGPAGSPDRTTAVVTVGIHLAEALHYLHQNGIIHRDVKSANVLVRPDRSACLIDFDSAIMPGIPPTQGRFVGTYTYAPPEQLRGRPVDARADVYAMGVLLFRMLSGKRPFDGDDPQAIMQHHLHTPPPALESIVAGVPDRVRAVVQSMLQKNPNHRPQSAARVAQRLRESHSTGL